MPTSDLEQTSAVQKAAILMVLLGPEVAGKLLGNLPRETIGLITTEIMQLDQVPEELARAVLEDYFTEALRPEGYRGGPGIAREMLANAEIPEQELEEWLPTDEAHQTVSTVLAPLLETPPEALAAALAEEHPQTAALVLLNLAPPAAAAVLARMPDEQRNETVQRMTALQHVEGGILDEVATSLQERLQDPMATTEAAEEDGMTRTAAVLQEMARSDVRAMLDEVEKVDAERAQELRAMVNTFDTLVLANDRGIQELLRSVETKTLVLALHGEEQALVDKFLNNLSERAGAMFREEMEFLSDVRPDDQKVAQNEIMAKALELEQEDKLMFEEPTGDDL